MFVLLELKNQQKAGERKADVNLLLTTPNKTKTKELAETFQVKISYSTYFIRLSTN